jgi:hypothetical protein
MRKIALLIVLAFMFVGCSFSDNPEEVVSQYALYTLGSLGGDVDYELAKEYLDEGLRAQFTDDSFIPVSYGIQEGPIWANIEFVSTDEVGMAHVVLYGFYDAGGLLGEDWEFVLEKQKGRWKIRAYGTVSTLD